MKLLIRGQKKKIYLRFFANGQDYKEPTKWNCDGSGGEKCSCYGHRTARGLGLEIEGKIKQGKYIHMDYFPNSKAVANNVASVSNKNMLMEEYMQGYLRHKDATMAYSTMRSYYYISRKVQPYFKGMEITSIKPLHIRELVTRLVKEGLAPKTIRNAKLLLSNLFRQAISDGLIASNPAIDVQLPKVRTEEPNPFAKEEVELILANMKEYEPQLALFFAIGFYTGMRTGEILALRWSDIDIKRHKISVTKTMTAKKLKMSPKTENRLVDIMEILDPYIIAHEKYVQNDALFIGKHGLPFVGQDNIVKYYWKPCLERLNIRYREPYQMRHTFAGQMLYAGEQIKWVANMLGHRDTSMITKRYGNWLYPQEGRAGQKFAEWNNNQ